MKPTEVTEVSSTLKPSDTSVSEGLKCKIAKFFYCFPNFTTSNSDYVITKLHHLMGDA